jgi:quercetin dioxygenase-like cupin family protein
MKGREIFMKLTRISRSQAVADASRKGYFEGEVNIQAVVGLQDSSEVELLAVYFNPGARTIAHTHENDQILQVIEGEGIVATETEKYRVAAGDVITVPAGAWHWHGATRNSAMCHISIKRPGASNWKVDEKNWASGYDE